MRTGRAVTPEMQEIAAIVTGGVCVYGRASGKGDGDEGRVMDGAKKTSTSEIANRDWTDRLIFVCATGKQCEVVVN